MKGAKKNNTLDKPLFGRGLGRLTLYGIPNCDTTKKAMSWLKKNDLNFSFHDYKQQGISKQKLEAWCDKLGWETIFNKRSTSWRELSEAEQEKVVDRSTAIKIMLEKNSIIKRPVIEVDKKLFAGFNETEIIKQLK